MASPPGGGLHRPCPNPPKISPRPSLPIGAFGTRSFKKTSSPPCFPCLACLSIPTHAHLPVPPVEPRLGNAGGWRAVPWFHALDPSFFSSLAWSFPSLRDYCDLALLRLGIPPSVPPAPGGFSPLKSQHSTGPEGCRMGLTDNACFSWPAHTRICDAEGGNSPSFLSHGVLLGPSCPSW